MKDALLVGPILVVGAVLVNSLATASSRHESYRSEELVFMAFLFGLLYTWYRGKQTAAERLRALELGRELPGVVPSWPVGRVIATLGIGAPAVLVGLAWMANSSQQRDASAIWFTTSLLGVTTLVCGTILLLRLPASTIAGRQAVGRGSTTKPETDPDAFDVVGQRGSYGHYPEERS